MQAALDLIRAYYAAFNARDRAAMTALLTGDVAHDLNQSGRETGRAAFAAFMTRMDASYREELQDVVIMASEDGTRAAAEYVVHGEYIATDAGLPEASGQRYVLPGGAFFEIRGGRVARITNYYDLQDWIRQVGG